MKEGRKVQLDGVDVGKLSGCLSLEGHVCHTDGHIPADSQRRSSAKGARDKD
jgi:hypothetical protein